MAFSPVVPRRSSGLGDTTPDLSVFRKAAAAPAPPVTGKPYVWPHPSGLFDVAIGANGEVGSFVNQNGGQVWSGGQSVNFPAGAGVNNTGWSEDQKATQGVVEQVWIYPFLHGAKQTADGQPLVQAVTGNEMPDSALLNAVSMYFAFNKGMVDVAGSGWQGTNTIQTGTIQQVPTVVQGTQPSVAAQYQSQITATTNALKSAIQSVPLASDLLTSAAAQLNITGPGTSGVISSVLPTLDQARTAKLSQLTTLLNQWAATWNQDLTANANALPSDLQKGQDAVQSALHDAVAALDQQAVSLLYSQPSGAQQQQAQQATSATASESVVNQTAMPSTTSGTGPTTETATPGVTTPATAGVGGAAAWIIGGGLLLALLARRKKT